MALLAPVEPEAPGPQDPGVGRRRVSWRTLLGVALVVIGAGCLGWVAYQYVGTTIVSERAFREEASGLRNRWDAERARAGGGLAGTGKVSEQGGLRPHEVPGDAIALLRVPRFGDAYEVPVLAGTDVGTLSRGVGHYDRTAAPGQIGNFALAGHRVTHGQPFGQLLQLEVGDQIVVETRDAVYTYVIDTAPRDLTVQSTAGWVLDPVPGKAGLKPSRALITLTTCQDLFHSPDRSVGFGHLASTEHKS